jgi:formylglycine-generating enzyme required for sulfatase activity
MSAAASALPDNASSSMPQSVAFAGGASFVGSDRPILKMDGEGPRRPVRLRPFKMDVEAVTNRRFGEFVAATGFRTEAEHFGWSFVFQDFVDPELKAQAPVEAPWWRKIEGACWRHPEGPPSTIEARLDHPAVHISWNDATAFAAWCGGRLPSEAEWEHAARGGPDDRRFPWGEEEPSDTAIHCNIWQGRFPAENTGRDGYLGTAPVRAFAPNPAGIYNMAGNVWEWCADIFRSRSLRRDAKARDRQAATQQERVMKGGSYLCHASYCYRYRIAARMGGHPSTSAGHTGFRVAFD